MLLLSNNTVCLRIGGPSAPGNNGVALSSQECWKSVVGEECGVEGIRCTLRAASEGV